MERPVVARERERPEEERKRLEEERKRPGLNSEHGHGFSLHNDHSQQILLHQLS